MFDVARQDVMKACGEVKAIQIWKFWKLWKSVTFWISALPRIFQCTKFGSVQVLACCVWRVLDKLLSGIKKVMILHEMSDINVKTR